MTRRKPALVVSPLVQLLELGGPAECFSNVKSLPRSGPSVVVGWLVSRFKDAATNLAWVFDGRMTLSMILLMLLRMMIIDDRAEKELEKRS